MTSYTEAILSFKSQLAERGSKGVTGSAKFGFRKSKTQSKGRHGTHEGISVFLLSTHHIPHALNLHSSTMSVSTKLVEQCLGNYRDAILLAREYGPKTEAERAQFRAHLLKLKRKQLLHEEEEEAGKNDVMDSAESVHLVVEKQLWNLMLCDNDTHPTLLSESLRYQQILQDMNLLARGVLVPLELLRHRNHWLLLQEDVPLNLADRLLHYRVVVRRSPPVELAKQLWNDLWLLLGAVWRQRERLLGVYSKDIPPFDIDGDVSQLPPSLFASPSQRDAYCERQRRYGFRQTLTDPHSERCANGDVKDSYNDSDNGNDDDDDRAFGPLLPNRVGITTLRNHAIRVPLISFFRSLRVRVWETPSADSVVGSNGTGGSDFARQVHFPSLGKNISARSSASNLHIEENRVVCNVAFFDNTVEDVEACQVPYISPQKFFQLRLQDRRVANEWNSTAVVHTYSDDAWNIAVLTVEFMLAGFSLAESCCGHPDYRVPLTSSLFNDILKLLVVCHNLPLVAAQNFIYAALHELSLLMLQHSSGLPLHSEENDSCPQLGPQPQTLAHQWYCHLCEMYGDSSSGGHSVLRDIAENGLRWSRQERWAAFQAAHALVIADSGDVCAAAAPTSGSSSSGGGIVMDSTQRVLSSLRIPLLPLHPILCTAATKNGIDVDFFVQDFQLHLSLPQSSFLALQELWTQLRVWRHVIERHAVLDGGCWKNGDARHTVVFREFVHVVRRALQLRVCEEKQREEEEEEEEGTEGGVASVARYSRVTANMNMSSKHRGEQSKRAVQHDFFRGVLERATLFSYWTDGCYSHKGSDVDGGDDDDDDVLLLFPFSQVFLPTVELLPLLCNSVESLRASSSNTVAVYSTLDSVVGVKQNADFCASRPFVPEATEAGLLDSVRTVIRELDVSISDQLRLITPLRRLLQITSIKKRALSVRRYLRDVWAAEGGAYVPIPPTLRGEIWGALLQVPPEVTRVTTYYALNTACVSTSDRQLAVDIPRCHQYHHLLASAEGHEGLRHIIKAWLLMNPELTYWQGMDSVCAVLLAVSFTDRALVLAQLQQLAQRYIPHEAVASLPSSVKSMEDHLHQLCVLLRYCDPHLSAHLIDKVECHPELFAISWFLTLFSHGLPIGKVCLLWDFLLVNCEIYPHCLTALCLAVLLHYRERLLGNDFSVCLLTLSRLQCIDVHHVLCVAGLILRSVPPVVASLSFCSKGLTGEARRCSIPRVDVQMVLSIFDKAVICGAEPESEVWIKTGLFLVDIRSGRKTASVEERVIGALLFPITTAHAGNTLPSQRIITQQATNLLLQLKNRTMAVVTPPLRSSLLLSSAMLGVRSDGVVSTSLREFAMAPHVVLFTEDMTPSETAVAELFAFELVRSGTPHVSILLGGFQKLKQEAPQLVVECGGVLM